MLIKRWFVGWSIFGIGAGLHELATAWDKLLLFWIIFCLIWVIMAAIYHGSYD